MMLAYWRNGALKTLPTVMGITGMELYTPDGKLIAKANGATLDANGYRGIAIVRVATSDGASSTHKLAL